MFFERPKSGERAVLVHMTFAGQSTQNDAREFEELVLSAGGDPVSFVLGKRDKPSARFFVGTGKLEELKSEVDAQDAQLVIFNHDMSPSQERNLEKELKCRVLDRTGLILDIFAQRARTHEGKLQVELAQLQHMSTRLIRGWTHLERQKGGIGLRGPGETQLETDRRLLRERMKSIRKRLEKVKQTRQQGRRSRDRAEVPTISLVGYTNVGKSSLFNRLTDSDVYAKDQLFATLDPTMRRLELGNTGTVVLADTVGFVSNLPHSLVEAFSATLEEAASSTMLMHVIDASDPEREHNIQQVEEVLQEIGASDLPTLRIYNKIDLLDSVSPRIDRNDQGVPIAVWLSVHSALGLDQLVTALDELLLPELENVALRFDPASFDPRTERFKSELFSLDAVDKQSVDDNGVLVLEIRAPKKDVLRALKKAELTSDDYKTLTTHQ